MLLDSPRSEVSNKVPDGIVLREKVLAGGAPVSQGRDGLRHSSLHTHGRLLERCGEGGANPGLHELVHALGVTAQEAEGACGGLLALVGAVLEQLEQRRHAVLLNDELGEVLAVAGERGEVGGRVSAGGGGARVQARDMVPDEEEDGLVLRDVGEAEERVVVPVAGGARRGDAEQPGDVLERRVERRHGPGEPGGGAEREEAAQARVPPSAAGGEGGGSGQRLGGPGQDAGGGAVVELWGPRRLPQQRRQLVGAGLEVSALDAEAPRGSGLLGDLVGQLDRRSQHLLHPLPHLRSPPTPIRETGASAWAGRRGLRAGGIGWKRARMVRSAREQGEFGGFLVGFWGWLVVVVGLVAGWGRRSGRRLRLRLRLRLEREKWWLVAGSTVRSARGTGTGVGGAGGPCRACDAWPVDCCPSRFLSRFQEARSGATSQKRETFRDRRCGLLWTNRRITVVRCKSILVVY